ncbi:MAG: ChbG/HpnK family deacetylase [Phycisphaerales bacterium]|nr:ChbG/HpnK family deacetylase [Phycisphaerales bacterium]
MSEQTNQGIMYAHEHGIVTSASLMVDAPAAADAVDLWQKTSQRKRGTKVRHGCGLSLGLHLDLGEWQLCDGEWQQTRQKVALDDATALRREIVRQCQAFEQWVGRPPTHIDSHQHVHKRCQVRDAIEQAVPWSKVIIRHLSDQVRFWGAFFGRDADMRPRMEHISTSGLIKILYGLDEGCTELSCHPGFDLNLASDYRVERPMEVLTLSSPQVLVILRQLNIKLSNFAFIQSAVGRSAARS